MTATAEADGVIAELLLSAEGRQDPYSRYARLRSIAPVHLSGMGFWVLTGYDDCQQVLRDPGFGKGAQEERRPDLAPDAVEALKRLAVRPPSMLFLNPPDHTRLRGLVAKAFTPKAVERMRPHIARLLDELLEDRDGVTDVMAALAFPLPVTVIGEMLGVPTDDRDTFQPRVRAMTALLEIVPDAASIVAAADASDWMHDYFVELLADRREHPGEDLITALLAAEDGGDTLSEEELISTVSLLFGAGFETTTNLIGNGLLALLRHPSELQWLRDHPAALPRAIEELLRWDSPVQLDGRMALTDASLGGENVAAGSVVVTLLGAANRDPGRFRDPDRLNLARDEGPPLSFGAGIHYCLGQALARLEGQVVFSRLLSRYPRIELAADVVEYRPSLTLRGLVGLPVWLGR